MATTDHSGVLPGGAALAATAGGDVESGAIEARGYWENAFRRLRRDRLAILSGVVIIMFILVAFIGAPLAVRWGGTARTTSSQAAWTTSCPSGPVDRERRSRRDDAPRARRLRPGRPRRVPPAARRGAGVARGGDPVDDRRPDPWPRSGLLAGFYAIAVPGAVLLLALVAAGAGALRSGASSESVGDADWIFSGLDIAAQVRVRGSASGGAARVRRDAVIVARSNG